jgi:hypothetical protein
LWIDNNIGFNDYKAITLILIARWCCSWYATGAGAFFRHDGTFVPAYVMGSGSAPVRGSDSFQDVLMVEESFACLYPYSIRGGKTAVYPIPYLEADFTSSTLYLKSSSILGTAMDAITGFVSGQPVATYSYYGLAGMLGSWNKVLSRLQAYIPISPRLDESSINLTCMTRICIDGGNHVPAYVTTLGDVPDHIAAQSDRRLIPEMWLPYLDHLPGWQALVGETTAEGCGYDAMTSTDMLSFAWLPTTHPLSGVGGPLAATDDSEDVGPQSRNVVARAAASRSLPSKSSSKKPEESIIDKINSLLSSPGGELAKAALLAALK